MEQAKDLVSRINEQVLELLGQHRILKSKGTDLQTHNAELLKLIENQKKEIDQFKEQIVKLKITRSITDKKGSTEVNTKIEELLREIDKCVGLLNQ
jgi:sugar-specific transcriptional regulator TrmB